MEEIKNRWEEIAKEAVNVLINTPVNDIDRKYNCDKNKFIQFKGWVRGWTNDKNWLNYGFFFEEEKINWNSDQCPITFSLLNNLKTKYKIILAGYSLLKPFSNIPKHRDSLRGDLAIHLPLYVPEPEKCILGVNDKIHHHTPGNIIYFDDSNTHFAQNNSKYNRIILYIKLDKRIEN